MKFVKKADDHELIEDIQINYLDEDHLKAELIINVRDFETGFIKPDRKWLIDSGKIQEIQFLIKDFKNKWQDYMDNNSIPTYKSLTNNVWKDINYIVYSCCVNNKEIK